MQTTAENRSAHLLPQSGHQYSRSLLDCCRRIERQIFAIASRNQLHTDRLAFMQRYRHDDTGRLGAAFFKPFFRLTTVFFAISRPVALVGTLEAPGSQVETGARLLTLNVRDGVNNRHQPG